MKKLLILSLLIVGMVFATTEFGSIEVVSPTDHGTMNPDSYFKETYVSHNSGYSWTSSYDHYGQAYDCFLIVYGRMSPPYDDYHVRNLYSYSRLTNHLECNFSWGYFVANDFELTGLNNIIEEITFWVIDCYIPEEINVMFYDDGVNGPSSLLDVISKDFTLTDTGDDKWGYDIYECFIEFSPYIEYTPGQYWVSFDPVGGQFDWLTPDKATSAIEETTWGQIKEMEL